MNSIKKILFVLFVIVPNIVVAYLIIIGTLPNSIAGIALLVRLFGYFLNQKERISKYNFSIITIVSVVLYMIVGMMTKSLALILCQIPVILISMAVFFKKEYFFFKRKVIIFSTVILFSIIALLDIYAGRNIMSEFVFLLASSLSLFGYFLVQSGGINRKQYSMIMVGACICFFIFGFQIGLRTLVLNQISAIYISIITILEDRKKETKTAI